MYGIYFQLVRLFVVRVTPRPDHVRSELNPTEHISLLFFLIKRPHVSI